MQWFQDRQNFEYIGKVRNIRQVQEGKAKTSRLYNSPVNFYRRRINNLLQNQTEHQDPAQ